MKNWWYYHKWYVACGGVLLGIVINLTGNALGLWHKAPDFQVAYVGRERLPEDTLLALEQAFASIEGNWDFNGDGEVIVRINQYINGSQSKDPETAYYEYASELTLIGDISGCESYFFLMDDPESFQRSFHLLADADGGCPAETDHSTEEKTICWADCPLLSQLNLETYSTIILGKEVKGDSQELLSELYMGRRCFYHEKEPKHSEQCGRLWNTLKDSIE